MPDIHISEESMKRLKAFAEPLEDTAETAFSKVLDVAERVRELQKEGIPSAPQPPAPIDVSPPTRPKTGPHRTRSDRSTERKNQRNAQVIGFVLDGKRMETGAGNRTLAGILKEFQLRDSGFMERLSPKTQGRVRRLVARNKNDLYENLNFRGGYCLDMRNGWWIRTHLGRPEMEKFIKISCKIAGVKFGTELKLIERIIKN